MIWPHFVLRFTISLLFDFLHKTNLLNDASGPDPVNWLLLASWKTAAALLCLAAAAAAVRGADSTSWEMRRRLGDIMAQLQRLFYQVLQVQEPNMN